MYTHIYIYICGQIYIYICVVYFICFIYIYIYTYVNKYLKMQQYNIYIYTNLLNVFTTHELRVSLENQSSISGPVF